MGERCSDEHALLGLQLFAHDLEHLPPIALASEGTLAQTFHAACRVSPGATQSSPPAASRSRLLTASVRLPLAGVVAGGNAFWP